MKKLFAMVMAFCMLGTTAYAEEMPEKPAKYVIAKPATQEVTFDGYSEMMQCYNIEGYYYFRLRDVAQAVTEHIKNPFQHFDVKYNAETGFLSLVRETDYESPEGTKEYVVGTEEKKGERSATPLYLWSSPIGKYGYVIDGYTFYKLRDVAETLLLEVTWCEAENVIEISSASEIDSEGRPSVARKPVIYLYPEKETDIFVKLAYEGDLTVTYPTYNDGWEVTAQPDGTLTNHADDREYSYLFWEGEGYGEMDFSEGFVVKGEDTAAFLQVKLAEMGLTPKEYNEFIVYWLSDMQDHAYHLISFQWENYDESAKLHITPAPDNMLRVFMAFKALEEPVTIPEQELPVLQREGFTVVEWGGTEVY